MLPDALEITFQTFNKYPAPLSPPFLPPIMTPLIPLPTQKSNKKHKINHLHKLPALRNLRRPIPSDLQLLKPGLVLNHQTLFVGQMQEADEAVAGGDIGHGLLGVDGLQAVNYGCEVQGLVLGLLLG